MTAHFILETVDDPEFIVGGESPASGFEVLIVGPRGAQGDAATPVIVRLAGEALGGHRAVKIAIDGLARYASPGDADVQGVVGVTTGAAVEDGVVTIQTSGEMTESGWSWTPGGIIYLAASGALTQILPSSGSIYQVGKAIGPTTMFIDPRLIAKL